ncbi:hypothetical protein CGI91_22330 [Vibrio parahaemolyticus]|uniref:hypothetical protein n=1 Tax=Vibrio parahaemolyticus TaxID=670 RepID=UPI001123CB61|nr:hypothetical protein [Vibrio parahaemolyticus]TOG86808.1 hypothetical protein CGI91_22330 [Vibrio parahaemolyticus]
MTKHQRKRLQSAQIQYLTTDYKHLVDFTLVCAGFSLATLSAAEIDPSFNLIVVLTLLLIFITWSGCEMFNNRGELKLLIKELCENYKNEPSKLREIKSYDIWFGMQLRTIKYHVSSAVSILFMGYTATEHLFKLGWSPF